MTLIQLVVLLIVIGVGLYLINRYIPMAESIKTILNIAVIIAACFLVLNAFGVFDSGPLNRPLGR